MNSYRPHNKSPLWDEFLEHHDRNRKYFNTKHKKAYCKRCIEHASEQLGASPEAKAKFEKTNTLVDSWDDWRYREAFELVEAISGRSSNMQRHIRTCVHIGSAERADILKRIEGAPMSRSNTTMSDSSLPDQRTIASVAGTLARMREDNAFQSDDDMRTVASSSANSSPELTTLPLRTFHPVNGVSEPPARSAPVRIPSPKIALSSILNGGGINGINGHPHPPTLSTMEPPVFQQGAPNSRLAVGDMVASLDRSIQEAARVRATLITDGNQMGNSPFNKEVENTALLSWLKTEVQTLRQENDALRRHFDSVQDHNETLQNKLGRYQRMLRELSEDEAVEDTVMSTPRASSAPAPPTPRIADFAQNKRRKLSASPPR